MSDLVAFEKQGSVGVITVNNPPVNALSQGVRQGLVHAQHRVAQGDLGRPAVERILSPLDGLNDAARDGEVAHVIVQIHAADRQLGPQAGQVHGQDGQQKQSAEKKFAHKFWGRSGGGASGQEISARNCQYTPIAKKPEIFPPPVNY